MYELNSAEYFILNESNSPFQPGDVRFFHSLESLLVNVEAIDVRNREYFAFTSKGHKLLLSAETDYAPVKATVEDGASAVADLNELLFRYLTFARKNGVLKIESSKIELAKNNLLKLVRLVPARLFHPENSLP